MHLCRQFSWGQSTAIHFARFNTDPRYRDACLSGLSPSIYLTLEFYFHASFEEMWSLVRANELIILTHSSHFILAGEIEKLHEHMSDEQIVQLLTQGADDQPVPDSELDCEFCTTSAQQALFMTAEVERFVTSHPDTFMAGQVACIVDVMRQVERMQLDNKTQSTISAYFSA
jgi:hypothetical protein